MTYTDADYAADLAILTAARAHWRDNRDFSKHCWKDPMEAVNPVRLACTPEVRARIKRHELTTLGLRPDKFAAHITQDRVWIDGSPFFAAEVGGAGGRAKRYGRAWLGDVEYKWYDDGEGTWATLTRADYKRPKKKASKASAARAELRAKIRRAKAIIKRNTLLRDLPEQFRAAIDIDPLGEYFALVSLAGTLGPATITRGVNGKRYGRCEINGTAYGFVCEADGNARFWKVKEEKTKCEN